MPPKYKVVFVLGGPGAGKGTQRAKIVEEFGYVHLSAGDLLRAERGSPGSQYGELIEGHITAGIIVPVEITCSLLERAMKESGMDNFLIDGFPRNQNNLEGWNSIMGDKVNLKFVIFFNYPLEFCTEHCLSRAEASSSRSSNLECLSKRFNTYMTATMPIIQHYQKDNLVKTINVIGEPDQMFKRLRNFSSNSRFFDSY